MSDLNETLTSAEDSFKYTVSIVKDIVKKCCNQLDDYMLSVDSELCSNKNIPDLLLEEYILNLTSILYFTNSNVEMLGIKEDTCKAIRAELYALKRKEATGTNADKDIQANLDCQNETLVLNIYSRAYKQAKAKVESGYEMINSLKKVYSRRMLEAELSNTRLTGKEVERSY